MGGVRVGGRGEQKQRNSVREREREEVQLEALPNAVDDEEAQYIFGRINHPVIRKFEDEVYTINFNKSSYLSQHCGINN